MKMLKMIENLAKTRKEDQDFFEATKFVQERIDLYYKENNANILRADAEHNETGRKFSGQLITYSTIIFGLISLVFSQDSVISSLDGYQKGFLFVGLISLFVSLICGSLEQWDAMQHYKKIASLYSKANSEAPVLEARTVKDLHTFKNGLFQDISNSSRSRGLICQLLFLSLATIVYLILLATIVFN